MGPRIIIQTSVISLKNSVHDVITMIFRTFLRLHCTEGGEQDMKQNNEHKDQAFILCFKDNIQIKCVILSLIYLSIHLIYTNTIHHCSVLIDGFTRNNILALSGTRLSPVLRSQNGQIGIFFLKHHSHSTGFLSYALKKFRSMKELFGCSSGESLKRFCVKPDNRVASYWSQRTFNLLKNPVSMWMEELG